MMRSKTAGLVLALIIGVSSTALAQQPGQSAEHRDKAGHNWQGRKPHGGFRMLLKGIELTAEQKSQLEALRSKHGIGAHTAQHSQKREQMKAARERGDTAALRQTRTQMAAEMKQRHEAMIAEIRAILTPAQREVFERNVAEAQKHFEQRAKRSDRSSRFGSGRPTRRSS